ncbi:MULTISPECIES: hypothetical protein [unclassified Pseudomonas]|uniref:hypothetical protein n=1 Tax=unclassified Pseudomonas TaxID=196821 RepID=UPI0021C5EB07|nr:MULTISPECIES: hypothetical protein [unclassified Pseudomonas]MCU1732941.1 hypothetical protein [Pseudomonas sp. 20P_3.2_Bac4]MCU1742393.1 hypothetical protein [Pseudomonas sp. 20P_3.2_Bac5]
MENGPKLEIERATYDEFLALWSQDAFKQQRLGQAFYNFFHLHRLADQTLVSNIYDTDGQKAITAINRIFKIK